MVEREEYVGADVHVGLEVVVAIARVEILN